MVPGNMGKARFQDVVPEGEGPSSEAITLRLPKKRLERLERCAKETQNNRTDTIQHLLRWGLNQYEGRSENEKGKTG
jgi:metal-responsive CopG/Arc/MetJ family transcriptional regulator